MRDSQKSPSLSPRDLAESLGVSESSVKRWVDAGRIPAYRTTGGHRRIDFQDALEFMRTVDSPAVLPGPLGIDGLQPGDLASEERVGERLYELLCEANSADTSRLLLAATALGRIDITRLCDGPVREAMNRIGHMWLEGPDGIFIEHRAVPILTHALGLLESWFAPDDPQGVAIGGAIEGDPSVLPSLSASTVLVSEGYD